MEWTRWTSRNRTFFKGGSFSKSTVSRCPTRPLYYYLIFFKKETKTYQMHLGVCFVTLFHQCFKQRDREKQEKREKPQPCNNPQNLENPRWKKNNKKKKTEKKKKRTRSLKSIRYQPSACSPSQTCLHFLFLLLLDFNFSQTSTHLNSLSGI